MKTLLQKSRNTVILLEAEFEKRQLFTTSSYFKEIDRYCNSFRKEFDKIKILKCLDKKAAKHVKTAIKILITSQTNRFFKIYKIFLHNILRYCNSELVLLCAAYLDKPKVSSLKIKSRIALLDYLKTKRLLYVLSILEQLATKYDIHFLCSKQEQSKT